MGPILGLCQAALDHVVERAPTRSMGCTFYDRKPAGPIIQLPLSRTAILVDTAHLHAYRAAVDLDPATRDGRELSYLDRARIRMDAAYVTERTREAVGR